MKLDAVPSPRLWFTVEQAGRARELIPDGRPVLGIGPRANWGAKTWPADRFIELVPMFIEMIAWSAQQETWQTLDHCDATLEQVAFVQKAAATKNKTKLIQDVKALVRKGGCVFEGVIRRSKSA